MSQHEKYSLIVWSFGFSLFYKTAEVYSSFILIQLLSAVVFLSCYVFQMDLVRFSNYFDHWFFGNSLIICILITYFVGHSTLWCIAYVANNIQHRSVCIKFISVLLLWTNSNWCLFQICELSLWIKLVDTTNGYTKDLCPNDCIRPKASHLSRW